MRDLETRLAEVDAFVVMRPKLHAKFNVQATELSETRRELADAQQLAQLAESRIVDAQEQLEMAMLDKEVAEERAEAAEAELEDVTERLAIAEVELGVLKDEQAQRQEGGADEEDAGNKSMSAGKDSLAYIQLEKHNDRLKEALLRLRDMSQETDQEQRRRIAEMEKDIVGLDELQCGSHLLCRKGMLMSPSQLRNHANQARQRRNPDRGSQNAARRRARCGGDACAAHRTQSHARRGASIAAFLCWSDSQLRRKSKKCASRSRTSSLSESLTTSWKRTTSRPRRP